MSANPNHLSAQAKAKIRLQEQMKKQNYRPATVALELIGDFWPNEEDLNVFRASIRNLRTSDI